MLDMRVPGSLGYEVVIITIDRSKPICESLEERETVGPFTSIDMAEKYLKRDGFCCHACEGYHDMLWTKGTIGLWHQHEEVTCGVWVGAVIRPIPSHEEVVRFALRQLGINF